jgi:DNA helicase-2/ATP-dependent DNA helicase PcrA
MNLSDSLAALSKGLNSPQKTAMDYNEGPLLILAGAGSGKTRVLTHRMARLILEGRTSAHEILAVTFTNKAAREMESRVYQLLSQFNVFTREPLWISTFHSFCQRVLKEHIHLLEYSRYFSILDEGDQSAQLKKVLKALNIDDKVHPVKMFKARIGQAKQLALSPQDVKRSSEIIFDEKTQAVYERYEEEMKKSNSLDFSDLLLKVYELFRMYPDVLGIYQKRFKYIMVDEYQDTNKIQYSLVRMLTHTSQNLCVVGDEDQSIYSWRGADITNILNFEKDFPSALVVKLEQNYRSSKTIVAAASALIQNNSLRKDKVLFSEEEAGDPIQIQQELNEYDEARFVVKTIESMVNSGDSIYQDIAIFYRTNSQSRVLEEQLRTLKIPYQLVGGVRFYDRMEVKDMISYLKLTVNSSDDISCKRIINTPARGIGKTTVDKIEAVSLEKKISFWQAIDHCILQKTFNSGTTAKLRRFQTLIQECQDLIHSLSPLEYYSILLDKTEYLKALQVEETPEALARIDNLEELSNAISEYSRLQTEPSVEGFLQEMMLSSDLDSMNNNSEAGVTMMTLHLSKGLEYSVVFIVGLEENLFPSNRGDEDDASEIEEERRLCYVGITRARKRLFLTYAKTRKVWGQEQMNQPSRFLSEIPKELVEHKAIRSSFANSYRRADYPSSPQKSSSATSFFPDYEMTDTSSTEGFRSGSKVSHPTFGVGSVYSVEGTGDQQKVSVLFLDQTLKKFVVKYARLQKLDEDF